MRNCYSCDASEECECGQMLINLKEYLPIGLYAQIEDIIVMQFDCEYHEG
jgi:hypothetical protein